MRRATHLVKARARGPFSVPAEWSAIEKFRLPGISMRASSPSHSRSAPVALTNSNLPGSGWITGKPRLTAWLSDRSSPCRRGPLDLAIETLRIEWQDWIAPCGRIIVHWECCHWQHNVVLRGSIPLQPASDVGIREYGLLCFIGRT